GAIRRGFFFGGPVHRRSRPELSGKARFSWLHSQDAHKMCGYDGFSTIASDLLHTTQEVVSN
ncbi:MAG: hypothetical protein AAF244_03670, partial [Pseudomonadota bacterium]